MIPSASPTAAPLTRWQTAALALVLVVAAGVRVWNLGDLPKGLFCDEAALGYNSWAILHHGVDENGVRLPLFVWSFGGYKDPVFIYSAMLPIGVLGLSEFSLRLTSALFGLATVLVLFFLGREIGGGRLGLIAAALLAVEPWHIHFSRIAFEVISFPFLVSLGVLFLVRFVKGRRTLPAACGCLGLCGYAYAIAKLFVPLFLACSVVVLWPTLKRRRREWALGLAVLLVTIAPLVAFDLRHREQGSRYFRATSILRKAQPVTQTASQFAANYVKFLSPEFLFRGGDPIVRHAVPGHGELEPYWAPLLVLGLIAIPLSRRREPWLILAWLALYPVGASLMSEVPSASRGLIGSVAFALVTACGADLVFDAVRGLGRRPVGSVLRSAAAAALVAVGGFSLAGYMIRYIDTYPRDSARGIYGFQFGYRDAIAFMEPLRAKYSRLMLTTNGGNQTQIFPLFYNRVDPRELLRTQDPGYLVLDPGEYQKYPPKLPVLYALRRDDLRFFSDYSVRSQVLAPDGKLEFVIAEVRSRKNFVSEWAVLGPFPISTEKTAKPDLVRPEALARAGYPGLPGTVYWMPTRTQFCRLNFNVAFAGRDGSAPGNTCGWALTQIDSASSQAAQLELHGADAETLVWLDGELLTPLPLHLAQAATVRAVALHAGHNVLLIKSCKVAGDWWLMVRVASPAGQDLSNVSFLGEVPPSEPAAPLRPTKDELKTAEGFSSVVEAPHRGQYPDYRGTTESYWVYGSDTPAALVWKSAPVARHAPTVFAFTGSMGEAAGTAELWVNGRYCLSFDLGEHVEQQVWHGAGCTLMFRHERNVSGNSGFLVLLLAAEAIDPGKPVALAVRALRAVGDGNPWFMVKSYRDTGAVENVTPGVLREFESPSWQAKRR